VLRRTRKAPKRDEGKGAFVPPPVFARRWQAWCAVAGGITLETLSSLWDLKPPPAVTLAMLSDELDRYMRSPAFLKAMKHGVGLISTPAYAIVTNHVTRVHELARKGVFRWL
jgi:hypothetical protein